MNGAMRRALISAPPKPSAVAEHRGKMVPAIALSDSLVDLAWNP